MQKITHDSVTVALILNDTLIIDESAFNKLEPATRGAILTTNKASSYDFQPNFNRFKDLNGLKAKLRLGEDVSMELAYHGITPCPELQSAYQAYLDLLNPLLDQIEALRPPYPFAANPQGKPKLEFTNTHVKNGSGYKLTLRQAKLIWDQAAPFWASGKRPERLDVQADGYSRGVSFYDNHIEIGCQNVSRWQVEQLALQMGWDFPF